MRRILFTLPLLLLLPATVAAESPKAPIIAVMDIEPVGVDLAPAVLERLTIFLTGRLGATNKYQVVPREQVKKRLVELKKESYADDCDQTCQIELGKRVVAQKTVTTQIVKAGDSCTLNLNIFDLKREASEGGASMDGGCDENGIVASLKTAVLHLVRGTGVVPDEAPSQRTTNGLTGPPPPVVASVPEDIPPAAEPLPPRPLAEPVRSEVARVAPTDPVPQSIPKVVVGPSEPAETTTGPAEFVRTGLREVDDSGEREPAVTGQVSLTAGEGFLRHDGTTDRTHANLEVAGGLRFRGARWLQLEMALVTSVENPVWVAIRPGLRLYAGSIPIFFRIAAQAVVTPAAMGGLLFGFGGEIPLTGGWTLPLELDVSVWPTAASLVPVEFRLGVAYAF